MSKIVSTEEAASNQASLHEYIVREKTNGKRGSDFEIDITVPDMALLHVLLHSASSYCKYS